MNNIVEIPYLDLWRDICFYEVYKDIIEYGDYIVYLSDKYNVDIVPLIIKIDEVKIESNKKIKEHHEKEKQKQLLFKTECEEERIKTIIQFNRDREAIRELLFDEPSLTVNKIKKLGFLKTR